MLTIRIVAVILGTTLGCLVAAIPAQSSQQRPFCTVEPYRPLVCFMAPSSDWVWTAETNGARLASLPSSGETFRVEFPGFKVATREAIRIQLGRVFEGDPGLTSHITVAESSEPVPNSFHFIYERPSEAHPRMKTIGYVTPSGWMVLGTFESGNENTTFKQFVKSYHESSQTIEAKYREALDLLDNLLLPNSMARTEPRSDSATSLLLNKFDVVASSFTTHAAESVQFLAGKLASTDPQVQESAYCALQLLWELNTATAHEIIRKAQGHPDEVVSRTATTMTSEKQDLLRGFRHQNTR